MTGELPPLAAVDALRVIAELHRADPDGGMGYTDQGYTTIDPACRVCGTSDEYAVPWPCETYRLATAGLRGSDPRRDQ